MRRHQTEAGLTIVELLIALSILAVVLAVTMTAYLTSLSTNQGASLRSRAAPLLTAVSGRIASHALTVPKGVSGVEVYAPGNVTTPLSLAPALPATSTACATYLKQATPNSCVTISNTATFNPSQDGDSLLDTPMDLYTTTVCWRKSGEVTCASSTTPY
ncbi:type II secretion system protein (plasmid) [Deinococcus sp. D7000]|nr:type II secretion system protein [Deinococcus sp. D7000]